MKTTAARVTLSISVILAIVAIAIPAFSADLRVPYDFPDVQTALDAAVSGDRVLVDPGIYVGGIDFGGKDVRMESTGGPENTVIDGNGGTGVQIGPFGVIEGFTIRNSFASFGAGMKVSGSGSVILRNIFENNHQGTGGFGAAIGGNSASPTIDGNLFRNNFCGSQHLSGVISFVNSSRPTIVNNVFVNNNCRCINMALPAGYNPSVVNNTFVGNRVAIRVDTRITSVGQSYRNNLIFQNEIGLEVEFGSADNLPVWENNLVFGNTIDYDGTENLTGLGGNISEDPLLMDVVRADFHLLPGSPAIDSGAKTLAPDTDFDGNPRLFDGDGNGEPQPDIGAFEFTGPVPSLEPRIEVMLRRGGNIDLRKRIVRVVLFSEGVFDVHENDLNAYAFGPMGAEPQGLFFYDADHDGADDLVLFFNIAATGLEPGDLEACLTGTTLGGREFEVCDDVKVYKGYKQRKVFDRLWNMLEKILTQYL